MQFLISMPGGAEWLLIVTAILLPVLALVEIIRSNISSESKIIWILVVLLLPFIGSILFLLLGRSQKAH